MQIRVRPKPSRCPQCGGRFGRYTAGCDECVHHSNHGRFESRCARCRAERIAALVRAVRGVAWRLVRGRKP
jgi:hypothetical protein